MDRLANALAAAETDQEADAGAVAEAVAWANPWREQVGLPPVAEEDRPPEEELGPDVREPSASPAAAAEILDRLGGRWALVAPSPPSGTAPLRA